MTLLLVCSEADVPSVNMRASLLSSGGWDDLGEEDGRACMMKGDLALLSVPTEHIRSDGVDRAAAAFGVEPEAAVFMSRHSSASGIPTLTVHPVGNLGASADLGGRPRALVPAAPALMGDALRRIHAHGYPGFRVSYEVTHHGPWLSVPSMFIEIGSDASTWGDAGAAAVLADVIASMEPVRHPVAVGIGGGHYAPRFTEVALGRGVDFGHMVPKHALDGADDEETVSMLRMAAEASSTGLAYVHRSSFKGAEYRRVAALAESAGLELASSKDFDPL